MNLLLVTGAGRQRPSVAGARNQLPDEDDAEDDDEDDEDDVGGDENDDDDTVHGKDGGEYGH